MKPALFISISIIFATLAVGTKEVRGFQQKESGSAKSLSELGLAKPDAEKTNNTPIPTWELDKPKTNDLSATIDKELPLENNTNAAAENVFDPNDLQSMLSGGDDEQLFAPPVKKEKSILDRFLTSPFSSPEEMINDEGEEADRFIEMTEAEKLTNQWFRIAAPLKVYKSRNMAYSFVAGGSDQLQWHSFKGDAYLDPNQEAGWTWMINYHFLGGPASIDLPPRLFDFVAGYQKRGQMSDFFSYDIAASVGAYSDFEGSAREGVRFVSHATGIFHISSQFDFVFGADYQDRDDYKLIPVLGFSYRPPEREWLRWDLIFPNPAIRIAMNDKDQVYFAGRLGGGSYAIEFPDDSEDVLTYRDYRFVVGFNRIEEGKSRTLELGFASSRQIEFRGRPDRLTLDDSFFIQYSWVR